MIPAKSTDVSNQSDAVVVSFDAEWHEKLKAGNVQAVIRKRIPKTMTPRWLYFHINAPIGAIGGRGEIKGLLELSLSQAKGKAKELALTTEQITSYYKGSKTVGCYRLGKIEILSTPLSIAAMRAKLNYFPPQSFMILSTEAKNIIDSLGGFRKIKA